MRKLHILALGAMAALMMTACGEPYDDSELKGEVASLKERLAEVETLLNASANKLTITSVAESSEGFVVTFSDGSTLTVKHGTNGKDGADGKDGQDGADGKNGADGAPGKDGADGKDGVDGKDGETLIESIIISDTDVTFILTSGKTVIIPLEGYYDAGEAPIRFLDNTAKVLCVMAWDTDGDQELSYNEAAAVTSLEGIFKGTDIISFRELKHFTGLTALAEQEFYNCERLRAIALPEGIVTLSKGVFQNCSSLSKVTLPTTLTAIGEDAFRYCEALTTLSLPTGVTTLGLNAFYQCNALTDITLPEGLKIIGERAFSHCFALKTIVLPQSVEQIDDYAFYFCEKLEQISLPEGLTAISTGLFYNCESLGSITLPQSVEVVGDYAFRNCTALGSVGLNEGLTEIGDYAFCKCTSLVSVALPTTLGAIGGWAFNECSALVEVVCPCVVPPTLAIHAWDKNCSGRTIYVPAASLADYTTAEGWSTYATALAAIEEQEPSE